MTAEPCRPVLFCDEQDCPAEYVGQRGRSAETVRAEAVHDGWRTAFYETELMTLDFCCPKHGGGEP